VAARSLVERVETAATAVVRAVSVHFVLVVLRCACSTPVSVPVIVLLLRLISSASAKPRPPLAARRTDPAGGSAQQLPSMSIEVELCLAQLAKDVSAAQSDFVDLAAGHEGSESCIRRTG
jgi:hypothetical protein